MHGAATPDYNSSGWECGSLMLPSHVLTDPLSFSYLQIDLEPEGKVYVIIDLSGSSGEGRRA